MVRDWPMRPRVKAWTEHSLWTRAHCHPNCNSHHPHPSRFFITHNSDEVEETQKKQEKWNEKVNEKWKWMVREAEYYEWFPKIYPLSCYFNKNHPKIIKRQKIKFVLSYNRSHFLLYKYTPPSAVPFHFLHLPLQNL